MIFARRQSAAIADTGVEVHEFYIADRVRAMGVIGEWRRLKKAIAEFRPHVIHAHYGTATAAICAVAAGKRPLIVSYRGSDLNPSGAVARTRSMAGRLLSQLAALRADAIICVSEQLRQRLWWRRDRVTLMSSGVDLDMFFERDRSQARAELGIDDQLPLVVFNCGRDPWAKNLELAEACVTVARGTVPGLEMIVMHGDWSPEQVPLLFAAADCLLVTSRAEGSPNVVREALACGLPVVSVDVGDVASRIGAVAGCRICAADPGVLGAAVAATVSSRARVSARDAASDYDATVVARRLVNLYGRLAAAAQLPLAMDDR